MKQSTLERLLSLQDRLSALGQRVVTLERLMREQVNQPHDISSVRVALGKAYAKANDAARGRVTAEYAKAQDNVQLFLRGKPDTPQWVLDKMASYLESGDANTLDDAYRRAIWTPLVPPKPARVTVPVKRRKVERVIKKVTKRRKRKVRR